MLFLKKQQKQQKIWKIATKNGEKKQLFAGLSHHNFTIFLAAVQYFFFIKKPHFQ